MKYDPPIWLYQFVATTNGCLEFSVKRQTKHCKILSIVSGCLLKYAVIIYDLLSWKHIEMN